jgi:hypothetical protein
VRVRATDSKGISSVREAVPPLNAYDNASGILFLAGNPDPGIGGNALSTVINNRLSQRYGVFDFGALAVSSRGVVYLLDRDNGILWINPQSGVLNRLGGLGRPFRRRRRTRCERRLAIAPVHRRRLRESPAGLGLRPNSSRRG